MIFIFLAKSLELFDSMNQINLYKQNFIQIMAYFDSCIFDKSIENAISPQLLDTGSILANVSDHTVIIKSLHSLKHVNAVESTQKMEFIDKPFRKV